MNTIKITLFSLLIGLVAACTSYEQLTPTQACDASPEVFNPRFPKADTLRKILQQLTQSGTPGGSIAVYSEKDGWWAHSEGYAKIEDKTPLEICHLHYLQSISKTYMAVAVMRLWELKKIELDAPITRYLPAQIWQKIAQADSITVRMLLNHTSGIPEYGFEINYLLKLLQEPDFSFTSIDYLNFIAKRELNFKPGSKHQYSNTNYLLLALLVDAITGDHGQFIRQQIFAPLELKNSFYRDSPTYLEQPNLVNSYWDRFGNGHIENVSHMQKVNVASLVGDDGVVCTPLDAVRFLKGLLEGKLLAPATVKLMQEWVKNEKGEETYGMGLYWSQLQNYPAIGHGGAGIGAGALLYYLPEQKLYVCLAVNLGTILDGPITERVGAFRDAILEVLVEK